MNLKQKVKKINRFSNESFLITSHLFALNKKRKSQLQQHKNSFLSGKALRGSEESRMAIINELAKQFSDGRDHGSIGYLSWRLNGDFIELETLLAKWRYHPEDLRRYIFSLKES